MGGVITTVHDTEVREGYRKKAAFVLQVKVEQEFTRWLEGRVAGSPHARRGSSPPQSEAILQVGA